jgi:hypothetical protein
MIFSENRYPLFQIMLQERARPYRRGGGESRQCRAGIAAKKGGGGTAPELQAIGFKSSSTPEFVIVLDAFVTNVRERVR